MFRAIFSLTYAVWLSIVISFASSCLNSVSLAAALTSRCKCLGRVLSNCGFPFRVRFDFLWEDEEDDEKEKEEEDDEEEEEEEEEAEEEAEEEEE